jgi:hypothetical protein
MDKARTLVLVNPVFTALQVPALLMLRNTPSFVPAYSVDESIGSIARERTAVLVRSVLAALQLPPLFVLLKTPPPSVAA